MRDDEPRPVWMSLLITHVGQCPCVFITAGVFISVRVF